jgi:hypothetical protein
VSAIWSVRYKRFHCTCICSTLAMRNAGGIKVIEKAIDGLSKYHDRHIMLYDPTLVSSSSVCVCVCVVCCVVLFVYHQEHVQFL